MASCIACILAFWVPPDEVAAEFSLTALDPEASRPREIKHWRAICQGRCVCVCVHFQAYPIQELLKKKRGYWRLLVRLEQYISSISIPYLRNSERTGLLFCKKPRLGSVISNKLMEPQPFAMILIVVQKSLQRCPSLELFGVGCSGTPQAMHQADEPESPAREVARLCGFSPCLYSHGHRRHWRQQKDW